MTPKRGASLVLLGTIRIFDVCFSLTALIAFSPVLLLIIVALRFSGEGHIFYRQLRVGRGGREFYLLKFVTMLKDSPSMRGGELTLPQDPRVLPLGRVLRKTKLNELPQLLNVVMGHMSLIGPRPQTRRYYNCFLPSDLAWIDSTRPGLSGVGSILFSDEEELLSKVADPVAFDAQVISPYKASVERWFAANQSLSLYFELLLTTVLVVLLPTLKLHRRILRRVPPPPPALAKIILR